MAVDDVVLRQRWWSAPEAEVHNRVFGMVQEMRSDQDSRRRDNDLLRALAQIKDSDTSYAYHGVGYPSFALRGDGEGHWTYNVIRTAIDVLGSKIGTSKPKASFVTNGGGWSEQRRAKKTDKYVYGVMHMANFYATARKIFRNDACATDLGALKGWVDDGRIKLERVDPDEIMVDGGDGYYGTPRTLVHAYAVSREQARAWVEAWHQGKSAEVRAQMNRAIDEAQAARTDGPDFAAQRRSALGDVVQVHEAWHLPTGKPKGKEKHDGRHVICLSSVTLLDEPATFFPFAFCRIYEPHHGFYGQGVGHLLTPTQRSISFYLRRISRILDTLAKSLMYVDAASKITQEQLAGGEPVMTVRGGKMPTVIATSVLPPDIQQTVDYQIRRGLEMVGINENAPAASKPAGLSSGQALRDYEDIGSQRQSGPQLAFEEFVLDTARLVVKLSAKAAEDGEKLTAFHPRGRIAEPIDWSDVAADEDSFTLQVYSASSLPTTPAARKQYVEEQWAAGLIDGGEYRRLLGMPDTDESDSLALAARDVVDQALEKMLDGDDDEGAEDNYSAPEPFDDLAYAVKRGMALYAKAKMQGAPEGRLNLVRNYIIQAQGMMQAAQGGGTGNLRAPDAAQPIPPGAPSGGGPPAAGPPGSPPAAPMPN